MFTCFYHRWTYDTKGSCVNIPRPEGYQAVGMGKDLAAITAQLNQWRELG